MSYQVLARKWRPQNFKEMVGQEHVLRALMNALDSDRLHHAYLFTGTRGVGKTTIARILAKCLNCETGITSTPCGTCSSCEEVAAGNFLDLIEVDAASRTKVEDTRELLENVQYAPTRARFKVYLIDEVHMLTGHSFNALLKTLEEPPPHVKFLFATTDPQKLPATILSRCLQFNLKRMPVDMISGHLKYLLGQESITFEDSSLRLLSRAADGSMRDALSLLDQAIAFSGSNLTDAAVRDMLGTISHEPLIDLLTLILAGNGSELLQRIEDLSSVTPDFEVATDGMISLLHQLAVQQVVPDAINDEESIQDLAKKITKEEVQLFYQIALQGRRDLPLSPDPRSGFEMLLLRMMSFKPLREGMALASTSAEMPDTDQSKKKTVISEEVGNKPETAVENIIECIGNTSNVISEQVAELSLTSEPESKENKPSEQQFLQHADPEPQVSQKSFDIENNSISVTSNHTDETIPPWEDIPPHLTNETHQYNQVEVRKSQTINELKSVSQINDEIKATEKPIIRESAKEKFTTNVARVNNNIDQPWHEVIPQLKLGGLAYELIKHCLLEAHEGGSITLILNQDREDLLADTIQDEIEQSLSVFYDEKIHLNITISAVSEDDALMFNDVSLETPAQRNDRKINETQQQAESNIENDPFVIELQNRFGALIVPGSIQPKNS